MEIRENFDTHENSNLAVQTPETALLEAWYADLELNLAAGQLAPSTCQAYRRGLDKFLTWCQDEGVAEVNGNVIRSWIAHARQQDFKPTTVNTWYAGVRAFFAWAVTQGILQHNPTEGVKGVKRRGVSKHHLRDPLTDREILRLLRQPDRDTPAGQRDYAILCLMAFTALRTIEIQRLDIGDLSTANGLPVLRVQSKGSREKDDKVVIAHAVPQEAVYDWLAAREDLSWLDSKSTKAMFISLSDRNRGGRLSSSGIRHMVNGYMKKAGILDPRKTAHSIRHAAISKIARQDVLKARQVARHASLQTTMIYVHEDDRLRNPGEALIDYSSDDP